MALGIPKDQIRYIVDKLHVGESDTKVRALIRARTAPHPGWTQARVKQAETYALKVHRDNQKMYAYVMGGSAGWRAGMKRKNPKKRSAKKVGRSVKEIEEQIRLHEWFVKTFHDPKKPRSPYGRKRPRF